ncbi:hypothetical protein E9564_22745, partial [Blastococcus sp. MG754427]|uniref:hypothetical protein n=1 Tax=Blastococcus sp. MG754427 TaxID=2570318 RepID=UPI001F449C6F
MTHGPSCRPGGIVVEVVAGSAPYVVVLATGRTPSGEDDAVLEPYASVVLRTGDDLDHDPAGAAAGAVGHAGVGTRGVVDRARR